MRRFTLLALKLSFNRFPQSAVAHFSPVGKLYCTRILHNPIPFNVTNPQISQTAATPSDSCKASAGDRISVQTRNGGDVKITPLNSFDELTGLPKWLERSLHAMNFPSLTSIQKYAIPALDDGHDMIGLAPTGSGKTVAFAVPALKRLKSNPDRLPSVLVLAPTRELVQQTTQVFRRLAHEDVSIGEAYGGTSRDVQHRYLQKGCDILVACPGRLSDFLKSGYISLKHLVFLVFDEADRLLDMGFQPQLDDILSYLTPDQKIQKVMWSATWPQSVQSLSQQYLSNNSFLIRVGSSESGLQVNKGIRQTILFADSHEERIKMLVELMDTGKINENTAKVIIFVERQSDTEHTARALSQALNIESKYIGTIHGGLSQKQRDWVMNLFKKNRIRLLVATDVASRGLDIPDVTCVVNFQIPKNIDSYCHRIGRTGRAGRSGDAYTFVGKDDSNFSAELIDYLQRCNIEVPSQLVELSESHRHNFGFHKQRKNTQGRERHSRKYSGMKHTESTGW